LLRGGPRRDREGGDLNHVALKVLKKLNRVLEPGERDSDAVPRLAGEPT
jgi:hypothetical protein